MGTANPRLHHDEYREDAVSRILSAGIIHPHFPSRSELDEITSSTLREIESENDLEAGSLRLRSDWAENLLRALRADGNLRERNSAGNRETHNVTIPDHLSETTRNVANFALARFQADQRNELLSILDALANGLIQNLEGSLHYE